MIHHRPRTVGSQVASFAIWPLAKYERRAGPWYLKLSEKRAYRRMTQASYKIISDFGASVGRLGQAPPGDFSEDGSASLANDAAGPSFPPSCGIRRTMARRAESA